MFRPDAHDRWVLFAADGGCYGARAIVVQQGKLKVGDRVGVLVDLKE
jgi:hypothetical protein